MNSQQPVNLFAEAFAANGNKSIIPETNDQSSGKASLEAGFPPVTQLPPSQGGIAPDRLDFNGILYMLSAFAYFQQSGGIFEYNQTLDYGVPAFVYYNNEFWISTQENGVNKPGGVQIPSETSSYWETFRRALGSSDGNPVGTIIMYWGTTAPEGYLICNGGSFNTNLYPQLTAILGRATTPDFRGLAPRGYDPNNINDPQGSSRAIGSRQGDAAINLSGNIGEILHVDAGTGPFYEVAFIGTRDWGKGPFRSGLSGFDASRVWGADKISSEFRMKNFSILYCIKHD